MCFLCFPASTHAAAYMRRSPQKVASSTLRSAPRLSVRWKQPAGEGREWLSLSLSLAFVSVAGEASDPPTVMPKNSAGAVTAQT